MDVSGEWVDAVHAIVLAIALASCAGFRAWLPLLLTGGIARLGYFELGEAFAFLATDRALLAFALATLLEIVADKIPAVDHALDMVSTLTRPAAGALLAASVIGRVSDPLTSVALGVAVGAPSALVPHAAKSMLRVAATTFTGGLANPIISVIEDLATIVLFAVAVLVPLLVVVLIGFVLLLASRGRRRQTTAQLA
jgi:hypothetical protein